MRLIDADKLLRDIEHYNLSDGKFQHWVEIQPSAQPDVPDICVGDMISRQAVIDMVEGWNLNQHIMNEEDALDDVKALPSAEPQIIHCKDCKHWKQQTNYAGASLSCEGTWADQYSKCPLVEEPKRNKGNWIVYKAPDKQHCGLVNCPFCGEDMIAEADEYNFCPNCGADMRGDSDE